MLLGSGLAWSAFPYELILLLGGTPRGVSELWALGMVTLGTGSLGAVLAWTRPRWGDLVGGPRARDPQRARLPPGGFRHGRRRPHRLVRDGDRPRRAVVFPVAAILWLARPRL